MKKTIVIICLMFCGLYIKSQDVLPSMTFVQTNYNNHQCFANQNASYIFYNELNHELTVIVDVDKLQTGQDSMDAWLDDLDDGNLILQGKVNSDKLLELTNGNSKTMIVKSTVKFNDISVDDDLEFTVFEISPSGILYRNTNNNYYDRIRANLQIEILPKDFKLDRKAHHLKNTIFISIGSGYINQFKPGMEKWINNDY